MELLLGADAVQHVAQHDARQRQAREHERVRAHQPAQRRRRRRRLGLGFHVLVRFPLVPIMLMFVPIMLIFVPGRVCRSGRSSVLVDGQCGRRQG